MIRTVLSAVALASLLAAVPASAEAGWPGGCGYGYGNFYGLWGNPYVYSQGAAYIPPYYAIHPPVYYSPHITARPYGASPYAWPPVMTGPRAMGAVAAAPAKPEMITNPYVKSATAATEREEAPIAKVEPAPLSIDNPYFVAR